MQKKLIAVYLIILFIAPGFSFAQGSLDISNPENAEAVEVDTENTDSPEIQGDDQVNDSKDESDEEVVLENSTGSGAVTTGKKPKPKIKRKPQAQPEEKKSSEESSPIDVPEEQKAEDEDTSSTNAVDINNKENTTPQWILDQGVSVDYREKNYSFFYFIIGAGITVILAIVGFVFISMRKRKNLDEHADLATASDIAEIDSVKTQFKQQSNQQPQTSASSISDFQKNGFTTPNESENKEPIDLSNLPSNSSLSSQLPSSISEAPLSINPSSDPSSISPNPPIKADTVE